MKKRRKKQSLQKKLALAFGLVIICVMSITIMMHMRTINSMYRIIYEKMAVQAEYYQQTFETEIQHVLDLQLEFFNDRKLPFLARADIQLSDYEKREALLSIRDKIGSVTGVSKLVESGVLYIPKSGYCITASNIKRMSEQDWQDMDGYLLSKNSSLHFDGENFCAVRTGEMGTVFSEDPNFVFVLTFSSEQVKKLLYLLNTTEKSGAFLYAEKENAMLESSSTDYAGAEIMKLLVQDENGRYPEMQRIEAGGKKYLVLVGDVGAMGLFVQYTEEVPVVNYIRQSRVYMGLFLAGLIGLSVGFILYTRKIVHKPLHILVNSFEQVMEGNLDEHIYRNEEDEFTYLYQGFNNMEDRLKQLIEEVYIQKNLAQKAELKQLQAQINPHFLYNSFFILSRRIKRQDYENAEDIAKHLGNYFKYLTRDGADFIPLRQETEHARSYAAIQGARFAQRLQVQFGELPEKLGDILVPRLILQPLLENSFEYGVENKIKDGLTCVEFQIQETEFLIIVEDNGEEASDEDILSMRKSLEEAKLEEVTGIVNIHRRLKTYFKGGAGLRVDRSKLGGIAITMFICR